MKKQQLEISDLHNWLKTERVLYASEHNNGILKRLYVSVGERHFEIEIDGKKIWQGMQPFSAIEMYNEL